MRIVKFVNLKVERISDPVVGSSGEELHRTFCLDADMQGLRFIEPRRIRSEQDNMSSDRLNDLCTPLARLCSLSPRMAKEIASKIDVLLQVARKKFR